VATPDRPIYRKFTGQRGSTVSVEQLWAGDDHLLLVRSSFGVERYRRFYYQDIEAFVIRPTTTLRKWLIGHSIGFATFGGLAAFAFARHRSDDGLAGAVFLSILAGIFLIGLLWQLAKGPTCVTFLQMRNGLERIASANRIRSSLKMRDRLATLVAAAAEAKAVASAIP
jgi:hypothetical protein